MAGRGGERGASVVTSHVEITSRNARAGSPREEGEGRRWKGRGGATFRVICRKTDLDPAQQVLGTAENTVAEPVPSLLRG